MRTLLIPVLLLTLAFQRWLRPGATKTTAEEVIGVLNDKNRLESLFLRKARSSPCLVGF